MLSDDESMSDGVDVPETVPAKASKGKGKAKAPPKPESEDEQEDGSDEEAEDEYSVDKILDHRFERGGVIKYKVKWLGYEDEADMTWEPAENL
jgi:chromobox protein 1